MAAAQVSHEGEPDVFPIDPDGFFIDSIEPKPVPGMFSTLFRYMPSGLWLSLGLNDTADVQQRCYDQYLNNGIVAALILTIQFAVLYLIPDQLDWTKVESTYGSGFVDVAKDILMLFMGFSMVVLVLALMFSLVQVLGMGELNGPAELRTLLSIVGSVADSGFFCCLLGVSSQAMVAWFYGFITFNYTASKIIWALLAVLVGIPQLLMQPVRYIRALAETKELSKTKAYSPIVLSLQQVKEAVDNFISLVGVEYLSNEAFRQWYRANLRKKHKHLNAMFAEKTSRRITKYIDDLLEKEINEEKEQMGTKYLR